MKFYMQTATTNACYAFVDTLQVLQDLDKMVAGHLALADKKKGTAGQVLVFCNCFVERLGTNFEVCVEVLVSSIGKQQSV